MALRPINPLTVTVARASSRENRRRLGVIPALWLTLALALLVIGGISAAMPSRASAATAGPRDAGAGANVNGSGGTRDWSNPNNVVADDTSYATTSLLGASGSDLSKYLRATDYGFSIPSGATIDGIAVSIMRRADASSIVRDWGLMLLKGGTIVGSNRASDTAWTSSMAEFTYGGAADLWGTTWTPAQINASDFGVSLYLWNSTYNNRIAYVDCMRITVTYSVPGTTTTVVNSGSPSTYGDNVTLTATVTRAAGSNTPSGTVTFKDGGTAIGNGILSGSGGTATATLTISTLIVGTHGSITAEYAGDSNFAGSTSSSVSQVISSRSLTITANDRSKTYGDAVTFAGTEFTTAGLVNSDTVTGVTLASAGALASAPNGDYPIIPSAATGTGLANYNIAYVNGTLTVSTYGLTITANNTSKVYGDIVTFAGTEFTTSGLMPGDSVNSVTLTSAGAGATSAAGSFTIVPSTATGTGLAKYTIIYANGILIVGNRGLTITADNATKIYGDTTTFAGTEYTVAGLIGSDAVTTVTLTSPGTDPSAPVGNYPIVPSAATGTGLANYNISYVNGSLMVRKGIVITASSVSKTYGDAFTFAGTEFAVTGLEGSDTVTSVTLDCPGADAAAAAGSYDIVISAAAGTGLDNYDVNCVNGALTVNPKTLYITAGNSSKSSGSVATLTGTEFTTSGLVNGDRVALVTLTSTGAEASASGGTHDIVPSAAVGQGLSNYAITYINGTLTVDKAAAVWSVTSSPAQTSAGEMVTLMATIKPAVVWSVTPPSVSSLPEGEDPLTYDIKLTPSGAVGTLTFNYARVMMTATVTYIKATGTVTFSDGGTVLGTARLVNGTATFTTSDLSAGSHHIIATYDGDGNFEGATTLAHVHAVQPGPGPNWLLIGGITGGALLLGLFLLLLFFLLRRRRSRNELHIRDM